MIIWVYLIGYTTSTWIINEESLQYVYLFEVSIKCGQYKDVFEWFNHHQYLCNSRIIWKWQMLSNYHISCGAEVCHRHTHSQSNLIDSHSINRWISFRTKKAIAILILIHFMHSQKKPSENLFYLLSKSFRCHLLHTSEITNQFRIH